MIADESQFCRVGVSPYLAEGYFWAFDRLVDFAHEEESYRTEPVQYLDWPRLDTPGSIQDFIRKIFPTISDDAARHIASAVQHYSYEYDDYAMCEYFCALSGTAYSVETYYDRTCDNIIKAYYPTEEYSKEGICGVLFTEYVAAREKDIEDEVMD